MITDQSFLTSIFAGDNAAFKQFYGECRSLFFAYFSKHYPTTQVSIADLYQDSILVLWSQIINGKITEDRLKCTLSTYLISIGINKMHEGYHGLQKQKKLTDALTKHPDSYHVSGESKSPILNIEDKEEEEKEIIRNKIEFLKNKYNDLGYPCTLLLRYTWYNNMSDSDILKAFGGYFSTTDSIKTKRSKCRKVLRNMYKAWENAQ